MTGHRITLLESQRQELQEWLAGHPDGHERGAVVLFRRLSRWGDGHFSSDRFLAVEIIKMTDDWVIESSPVHIRINMRNLPEVYLRCEIEGLELGFIHNHPTGFQGFSDQDNTNELNILHGLSGCNGPESFLVSMLLVDGRWSARIRQGQSPNEVLPVRHVAIIGDKVDLHGIDMPETSPGLLIRQEAAFGKPFNSMLQSLRVVVVGAGGTGSPAATLLARAGVGELIIVDGDFLEESNMNRVRGYCSEDVDCYKAESLAGFIDSLGLNVKVSFINSRLGESGEAIDALSSADVVFGCTDDQFGRSLMNEALYYYAQVYIDSGLTGYVDTDDDNYPYLRDHRGRVSCILPESGACLRCQKVVTEQKLKYELAIKERPELAELDPETLKRDYYLIGGGEQAPGVGPFTSATADNAVATLMDLIRPYRRISDDLRRDNVWIDFVHLRIHSNEPVSDSECIYCSQKALLLKKELSYRLDMPILGKIQ